MTALSSATRGVLIAFGAYAVFAFSDASIKILHGGVPAYQIAFIGALFGCAALPFIKAGMIPGSISSGARTVLCG